MYNYLRDRETKSINRRRNDTILEDSGLIDRVMDQKKDVETQFKNMRREHTQFVDDLNTRVLVSGDNMTPADRAEFVRQSKALATQVDHINIFKAALNQQLLEKNTRHRYILDT